MYLIKIGLDKYHPETKALVETLQECSTIYWHYYTSVQSVDREFYVLTICLDSFTYYDITKGPSISNACTPGSIKCTKNINYIKDTARYLDSQSSGKPARPLDMVDKRRAVLGTFSAILIGAGFGTMWDVSPKFGLVVFLVGAVSCLGQLFINDKPAL